MDELPLPVLIVLIIAAVVAGLYLGHRAGERVPPVGASTPGKKSLAARARDAATRGVVRLWKWNRERKRDERN